jgi:spermidine synthase
VLTDNPEVLAARFRERGLKPSYLTEYDFILRMAPDRMKWLRERLAEVPNVKINRDFFPVCYYYDWLRWAAQFSQRDEASARRAQRFLALAADLRVWWLALPLMLIGLGRLLSAIRNPQSAIRNPRMVAWTLFCSGFGGIALEMLLVFAFQSLYGYVYYQVGLLITAFMLGLLLGAYRMNRLLEVPKVTERKSGNWAIRKLGNWAIRLSGRRTRASHPDFPVSQFPSFPVSQFPPVPRLARLQLALTLYALLLPLVLWVLAHFTHQALLFLVVQVIFPALVVGAGALVGAEFPLASHICLPAGGPAAGRTGGSLYAADLLGACCGAFLVSALLLPLLGVGRTCLGTALLLASAVVGLGGVKYRT